MIQATLADPTLDASSYKHGAPLTQAEQLEVDVDVLDDAVREPDETFVLRLTGSSNAPLSSTSAAATIEAND